MIYLLEAALIGATVIVATNLDNLLLSVNMAAAAGVRRTATILFLIQGLVIALAYGLSQGLAGLSGHWIGYLGFLPIALGIRELLRKDAAEPGPIAIGAIQSALLLAANSGDSLAVLLVAYSDVSETFDPAMTVGAVAAAVMLAVTLVLLGRWSSLQRSLAPIATRIQPWLMVLVGLLVLLDTPFDVQ